MVLDPRPELRELLDKHKESCVIVEGLRDVKALENLGFSNIVYYNKPAWQIAEWLEHRGIKKVIILTDLDRAGRKKYMELKRALTRHGITVHDEIRHYLFTRTSVSHIEGLDTYLADIVVYHKL